MEGSDQLESCVKCHRVKCCSVEPWDINLRGVTEPIFYCTLVEVPVINAKPPASILFTDQHYRTAVRTTAILDNTTL